jgi:hypothetical protein
MNKMWHICSYKQAVVLPYIYFACLWTLGCWGNGAWKMILMAGGRGQVKGGKPKHIGSMEGRRG